MDKELTCILFFVVGLIIGQCVYRMAYYIAYLWGERKWRRERGWK